MLGTHRDSERDIGIDKTYIAFKSEALGLFRMRAEIHPSSDSVIHRAGMLCLFDADGTEMRIDEGGIKSEQMVGVEYRRSVDSH